MTVFYSEWDKSAAAWLDQLAAAGQIAPGRIDSRSIAEVRAEDLEGVTRAHFFAGIGGWDYALRLAGWPADLPVWTGSCPCQPFSAAGKRKGTTDERHLWPEFFRLIRETRPRIVFGEQVASSDVIGRVGDKKQDLSALQDREAVFRVLCELERNSPTGLQRMRKEGSEGLEAWESNEDITSVEKLERPKKGIRFDEYGEIPSEIKEDGFRSGPKRNTSENRCRHLRDHGYCLRFDETKSLECALFGQNGSNEGVHQGQCEGDSLCRECYGEYLGTSEDFGNCIGDSEKTNGSLQQLIAEIGGNPPGSPQCWLDGVFTDLEGAGYTCGAAVLGAHSAGAPHIRQRLYWVAVAIPEVQQCDGSGDAWGGRGELANGGGVGIAQDERLQGRSDGREGVKAQPVGLLPGGSSPATDRLEYASIRGREQRRSEPSGGSIERGRRQNPWADAIWIPCRDGKARRIKSGLEPMAHGVPARVVRLRGYGNAIVPKVAAEFVQAVMEYLGLIPQI